MFHNFNRYFLKLDQQQHFTNCGQFQQREGGSPTDEPAHTNHAGEIQKHKTTNKNMIKFNVFHCTQLSR